MNECWLVLWSALGSRKKLHLKFPKYILKDKTTTCSNVVYGELGRYLLSVAVKKRVIGYWGRLINGKESKLSRVMYNCLLNLFNSGLYISPLCLAAFIHLNCACVHSPCLWSPSCCTTLLPKLSARVNVMCMQPCFLPLFFYIVSVLNWLYHIMWIHSQYVYDLVLHIMWSWSWVK